MSGPTDRARASFADALREVGLEGCARGVRSGRTSRLEKAALEAIASAADGATGEWTLLYGRALAAHGLPMDPARHVASPSSFDRAVRDAMGQVRRDALAPRAANATPADMRASARGSDRIGMADERTSITEIEAEIGRVQAYVGDRPYTLRMTPDERSGLMKEIWLAMLVATAAAKKEAFTLAASGIREWPDLGDPRFDDDDATALSIPVLQALQVGTEVTPSRVSDPPLQVEPVRRYAALRRGGVLGRGGRVMRLVEFDPDEPTAGRLGRGSRKSERLETLILDAMTSFEVGARGRHDRAARPVGMGARQSIVTFLSELHSNAYAYARHRRGVRVIRLGKHLIEATKLEERAGDFPGLEQFVNSLRLGNLNLVEASVSDFGPGMLDSFLASEPGRAFRELPRAEVAYRLIHERLSSNGGDPNAGLGTIRALEAAASIGGFVSVRTGEHWLTTSLALDGSTRLTPVVGTHPKVVGTHWTLLYPDPLR